METSEYYNAAAVVVAATAAAHGGCRDNNTDKDKSRQALSKNNAKAATRQQDQYHSCHTAL
jgi:hypothetical protein